MKIKKKIATYTVMFSISFWGCQKLTYNLDNLYQGDKMVLNGFLDSELGCVVKVSKTTPSTGSHLYEELKVKDARVFLYENGDSILELKQDTSGKYISSGFLPKTGSKYKIRSTSLNLPECQSEEEIFNGVQQTGSITTVYSGNIGYGAGIVFTFNLNFDTTKLNYYLFYSTGDDKGVGTRFLNPTGIDASCDLYVDYWKLYLSSKCFTNGDQMRIGVGLDNYSGIKPKILKLNISAISPVFYKYITSLSQPLDIDFAFVEPNALVTNIKGGYGIFYTKNTKTVTYKF